MTQSCGWNLQRLQHSRSKRIMVTASDSRRTSCGFHSWPFRFRVTVSGKLTKALLDAEHSLCTAPWSGSPCRTTSAHSKTMSPLDRARKPGFSPDTSVFSALETFVIRALYNSTFTIPYHTIPHICATVVNRQRAVMSCGWEGNRRSGVALAMHHRLQWFMNLRPRA